MLTNRCLGVVPHIIRYLHWREEITEMDTSELLDQEGMERYQSLIGSLQWAVSLGHMDIATAVMTMSSF
jgi:hypothetical protein